MARNQKNTRRKSGKRRFYKRKTFWLVLAMVLLVVAGIGCLAVDQYTREYRERAEIYDLEEINTLELPSIILDRSGKEIGRIFVQNRSIVPVEAVPDLFIDTLRAGEDSRFLTHDGIDYIGVVRAVKLNYQAGTTTQGASTITQQLARNAYPLKQDAMAKGESSIQRKLVEAFLARRIEKRYSKKEILGFYLNRIYFGSGFYGIRSASLGYFGKEPNDLNLSECATIVGLIKNPTGNSPLNSLTRSKVARDMVLTRMVDEGMISRSEAVQVKSTEIKINPKPIQRGTSHLYERIADAVAKSLGDDVLATGGFRIHTTISAEIQDAAQQALALSLDNAEKQPGYSHQKYGEYEKGAVGQKPTYLQGAVFMMDHTTGEVLAHVGGRDYAEVPYDFIEMGERPLGTAFFPFLYATGLAGKHTPASTVEDEPMDNRSVMVGGREGILGEWGMEVPSPKYEGRMTLRRAFEKSKIAATVRLAAEIGVQRIINAGVSFGFDMKSAEPLPRVSVGWEPASLKKAVTAMSTFPLLGKKGPNNFTYLTKVEDQSGKVVFRQPKKFNPAGLLLDESVAWQVHSLMAGGMDEGSASGLRKEMIAKPFYGAGKGGTTHDFADTWFLGYNARITCGVWTGFLHGNTEPIYPGAFSRDISMPVWAAAMNAATPAFGGKEIERPASMVEMKICSVSGKRATQFCQEMAEDISTGNVRSVSTQFSEWFRKGTDNLSFCTLHSGAIDSSMDPNGAWNNMPALDAIPIRPKNPVLIGEDPYHTELPSYATSSDGGGLMRRSTNVLDSLDLGDFEDSIKMRKPEKMEIYVE
ncbi:transglycosylase domain-containing protein [Luteolibacter sp. AS25]|uniref:transglycosylase domain-containing protein n=1 Tax=Luteolibacter sp. AS25 TaxID=3135776 RepID=UPI00398ABEDA